MTESIKDCRWPWNRLYIHANGEIKPCCYATAPLGNVLNGDDPDEIWDGAPMKELREYINENRIHRVCAGSGCSFIRSQIPKDSDFTRQTRYPGLPVGIVPDRVLALAELGVPSAMYSYGIALLDHTMTGVQSTSDLFRRRKNLFLSLRLLRAAAIEGQAGAAYTVAARMFNNKSILLRLLGYPRMYKYARRAADLGMPEANILIGMMYLNGLGVRRNAQLAEVEFKIAAEAGQSMGYLMLGKVAASYDGRTEDAYKFFKLAERRGETEATELLAKLNYVPPVIQSDKAQASPDGGTKVLSKGLRAPITP